ncbi:MAG: hypothetical protein ACIAQ0_14770 [Phycisphaerales bacterium JB058]
MKHYTLALTLVAACMTAPAAAEPHLVLRLTADRTVIAPGESVHWELWAELLEPELEIGAVISEIGFSLSFGGNPSLGIDNNDFAPAFDSLLLGPADDGTVIGDSIYDAHGGNIVPPLSNPGGPDSSNPLFIYSFTTVHNGDGGGEMYTPEIEFYFLNGAYVNTPFYTSFWYLDLNGNSDVPFSVEADTVYNVPSPATGVLALISLAANRRRSR